MFKIIKFNPPTSKSFRTTEPGYNQYSWNELKANPILTGDNWKRTLAGMGTTEILDLEKRSSWTPKKITYRYI
jgi:hypothetical protein